MRVPGIEMGGPGIEMRGPGIEIGGARNGSSAQCSESVKGPDHKAWLWLYRSPHIGWGLQRGHDMVPKNGLWWTYDLVLVNVLCVCASPFN